MATKIDPTKYLKCITDMSLGKKNQDYNFEASIYHDQIQSRDNLINMYKEGLITKEMTDDEKFQYLRILEETINNTNYDMKTTQIGVDAKEKQYFFQAALLFGASILLYIFEKWLESRK